LAVTLGLALVIALYWWTKEETFPFSPPSAEVQIKRSERPLAGEKNSVYIIKAGAVEGEAVLTSSPTPVLAQSLINSQIIGVTSTFESSRAPYPGQITAMIECYAKKYVKERIVPFAGSQTKLILAVANGRRISGSCSVEDIRYASAVWAGYDGKRRQVVSVKLFKPLSNPAEIDGSQQEIFRIFGKIINYTGGT
jgi:hypothetical protein